MNNSERLVVITGGTKGIGRSLVERFAKEGFSVATCARNESDLISLRDAIKNQYEVSIHAASADLSNREEVSDFITFILMIG